MDFWRFRQLYGHAVLNPNGSPQNLQDKVQFDIRFYFIRRANENIDAFTKDTFVMEINHNNGLKYVKKVIDEQTKNHQDDTSMITGIMPEMPNSPLCPISSFMKYVSKLNPRCEYLWQQAKDTVQDCDIWYKPLKIGKNPLAGFMSRISHDADLSQVYTNHLIRVTGTTLLGRYNFSDKQIMAVSGHRSVNSLSVYKKVSDEEKITMGLAMTHYLQGHQVTVNPPVQQQICPIAPKPVPPSAALGAPLPIPVIQPTNAQQEKHKETYTSREIVQFEPEDPLLQSDFAEDLDFDVNAVLNDIEQNVAISQIDTVTNKATTIQCQTKKKGSPTIPIFNNCKIGSIGNIHFHIHKNWVATYSEK